MTALLGVFNTRASLPGERALRDALAAAGERHGDRTRVHVEPGVLLGFAQRSSDPASVTIRCDGFAFDEDYIVLADATLYYVGDLCQSLGERVDTTASPARLILAAFRAFGPSCVDHIEGDFAFLVWDRYERRVFCARDFSGRRPLFLAEWRGGLAVASSLDSLAALPGFDPQVNLAAVGADAAGLLFSLDDDTCMLRVRTLRAGCIAQWSPSEPLRTERVWQPVPVATPRMGFDDAAAHLQDLLARAVSERMSPAGPTAVWMSGGRDSTAVFGAGMHAMRSDAENRSLIPISRSHPPGDSGREDEVIEAIARFWHVEPHWVDAQRTPMFGASQDRTRWSAEPFAQPFENLTRSLAQAARDAGASVALDGYGGDFLFQVSRIYLADLVAGGRFTTALRDWRAMDLGREGLRGFFGYGVQPLLPSWATAALGVARGGRRLRSSMERAPAPWIRNSFFRQHEFADRFASLGPAAQQGRSAVERETRFYLTHQFFARINSRMADFALHHDIELRSPLLDQRVVRFALSRPREERNAAGDDKRLLRASMRGLLPDSVLVARRGKTGTLTSYFAHHMRNEGLQRLSLLLPAPALADAGIVEPRKLEHAVDRYTAEGSAYPHADSLFCTLQAESWLRARSATAPLNAPALQMAGSA